MKPGPAKKPTNLKILMGNPGKKPLNKNEPKFKQVDELKPPSWLSAGAKKTFKKCIQQLKQVGLFTVVDEEMLLRYCGAHEEWVKAYKFIQEHGQTYPKYRWIKQKDEDGNVYEEKEFMSLERYPQTLICNEMSKECRAMASEFGFSPASRSNLKGEVPEPVNPVLKLGARKQK